MVGLFMWTLYVPSVLLLLNSIPYEDLSDNNNNNGSSYIAELLDVPKTSLYRIASTLIVNHLKAFPFKAIQTSKGEKW